MSFTSSFLISITSLTSFFHESPKTALVASVGAGIVIYYLLEVVKHPVFACRPNSQWGSFLEKHLKVLQEKYWPTPWCFESRAQTILASFFRSRLPIINYKRDIFKLRDGGEVCIDWLDPVQNSKVAPEEDSSPIVVLLPGLTGHSQSEYVKSFVFAAHSVGAKCVVFNNRGRGGIPLKTARTYCAANSDDLEEILGHIKKIYPKSRVVATGISLGGMILGNFLVTRGQKARQYLEAAMVLSVPWNPFVGTESLEKPIWNLLLNRFLAQCLCDSLKQMTHMLEGNHPWDLDHVMKSKTIREFDSRFTAVQFGFKDVEDYYRTACLPGKLHEIRVPLVCLSAADDPFQPIHGIPYEEARKSSHVGIIITSRGGHIGFMEGILPTNRYFSDRLYAQLLQGIFNDYDSLLKAQRECDDFQVIDDQIRQ
ncbi:UNVERIFIED_CONTAM: hypothetical protein RMT77_016378 [Armadillidium vulgare]